MVRPALEVADIFRDHGSAWRSANAGHVSLDQMKVMSAIERCRTAALGGHVARCENGACAYTVVSYNSCRNRHCPKCQGAAAQKWLAAREAELLPVSYFHVVYTLPSQLRDVAYQNKRVIYDLLMKAAAETTLAIAADPKRLGARIGITAVLHTWGSAMTHHPHVHMIVPGGGLSLDGARWVAARANFLVHVNVLARLFRGKMLAMLMDAHRAGQLKFFNTKAGLADKRTFKRFVGSAARIELRGLRRRRRLAPQAMVLGRVLAPRFQPCPLSVGGTAPSAALAYFLALALALPWPSSYGSGSPPAARPRRVSRSENRECIESASERARVDHFCELRARARRSRGRRRPIFFLRIRLAAQRECSAAAPSAASYGVDVAAGGLHRQADGPR